MKLPIIAARKFLEGHIQFSAVQGLLLAIKRKSQTFVAH